MFKILLFFFVVTGVFCKDSARTTEAPGKELNPIDAVASFQQLLQSSEAFKEIALMINQLNKQNSGISLDEITEKVGQFYKAITENGKDGQGTMEDIIKRYGEIAKTFRRK